MKIDLADIGHLGGLALDQAERVVAGGGGVALQFDLSPGELRAFGEQLIAAAARKERREAAIAVDRASEIPGSDRCQ